MATNLGLLSLIPDCPVYHDITDDKYKHEPAGLLRWRVRMKAVGHESSARILANRGLPLVEPRRIPLETASTFGGDDREELFWFDNDRADFRRLRGLTDLELQREMDYYEEMEQYDPSHSDYYFKVWEEQRRREPDRCSQCDGDCWICRHR